MSVTRQVVRCDTRDCSEGEQTSESVFVGFPFIGGLSLELRRTQTPGIYSDDTVGYELCLYGVHLYAWGLQGGVSVGMVP